MEFGEETKILVWDEKVIPVVNGEEWKMFVFFVFFGGIYHYLLDQGDNDNDDNDDDYDIINLASPGALPCISRMLSL